MLIMLMNTIFCYRQYPAQVLFVGIQQEAPSDLDHKHCTWVACDIFLDECISTALLHT